VSSAGEGTKASALTGKGGRKAQETGRELQKKETKLEKLSHELPLRKTRPQQPLLGRSGVVMPLRGSMRWLAITEMLR
jgi:hypothetical protein